MIMAMMWIWIVLFLVGITATCWVGWNVHCSGNKTENYDIYGWLILLVGTVVFDGLSWFTAHTLWSVS